MKKGIIIFLIVTAVLLSLTASTLAWLVRSNIVTFPESFGSAQASYFGGGDGTKNDPYIITQPVHLYNLAWLQYLGYFNMCENFNNGHTQSYFRLDASIDMSNIRTALPPIGTAEYPFVGKFDGNGHIISNLTVSNSKNDIKRYPAKAVFSGNILRNTQSSADISIVGLFGVVGNYNNYIADGKYGNNSVDTKAMSVSGFYADSIIVKSTTPQTLVGLVAGYVGADVKNTGVYRCNFTLAQNATGLDGYDTTVSKYSIVGDYDANTVSWNELESVVGTPGTDAAWGGSLDMRTINRRLTYLMAKYGEKSGYNMSTEGKGSNVNLYGSSTKEYYWNADASDITNYLTMYLNAGTVLPINVDNLKMGLDTLDISTEGSLSYESKSSNGFTYSNFYKNNGAEIVATKNTGYIVGGGRQASSYIRARIQELASQSNKGQGGVYKSFGLSEPATTSQTYAANRFEILTIDVSGGTYRINDGFYDNKQTALGNYTQKTPTELGLSGYIEVRKNFDQTMKDAKVVHGFHFMNSISTKSSNEYYYGKTDNTIKSEAYFYDNNTQSQKYYKNYEFVKGGINFTLSEDGAIKTILGSFYLTGENSLFDLYKVTRNSDGAITGMIRIETIYQDNAKTVYYNPTADEIQSKGLTKVFDLNALTKSDKLTNGAAYYFEIPVTAGDYVIGADAESSASNAYLMYLDIGANGSSEATGTAQTYSIAAVDFVSPVEGGTLSVPTSTNSDGHFIPEYDDVIFSIAQVADSDISVWFKRESWASGADPISTQVLWYLEGAATVAPMPQSGMSSENANAKWNEQSGG